MNILTDNLLFSLFCLSFIAGLGMLAVPGRNKFLPQKTAFYASIAILLTALTAYCIFCFGGHPQLFSTSVPLGSFLDIKISLGADRFSMLMILLSAAFLPVAILFSRHAQRMDSFFYACLFFMQSSMIGLFSSEDFFSFLFFWQTSAFPLFLLSGIWGKQGRIATTRRFISFCLVSSMLLILGFFYLADNAHYLTGKWLLAFKDIAASGLGQDAQFYAFAMLAAAFMLRIPVFPIHTWFPSLASENQPATNMILSALYVPSGLYAFIKIILPICPLGLQTISPYAMALCSFSCTYAALMAWAASSLPSLISYILSAHFSIVLMALLSCLPDVKLPAMFHITAISITATLMFALSGALESRKKTPFINELVFIPQKTPRLAAMLYVGTFSLACIPCLGMFAGADNIIRSLFKEHSVYALMASASLILIFASCSSALIKIAPFRKRKNASKDNQGTVLDLNLNEFYSALPLAVMLLFSGLFTGTSSQFFASFPLEKTDSISSDVKAKAENIKSDNTEKKAETSKKENTASKKQSGTRRPK